MMNILNVASKLFESGTIRTNDVVQLVSQGFENADDDKHRDLAATMTKGIVKTVDGEQFTADFDGTEISFHQNEEGSRWRRA